VKQSIYINIFLVILGCLMLIYRKPLAKFLTIFQSFFLEIFKLNELGQKFLKLVEIMVVFIGIFVILFGLTGIFK